MALFNYTSSYSNISSYLSAQSGSIDWLKIFVSPDVAGGGHFITHGIDFTPTYTNGSRGLVPANSGTLSQTFLRGDGWSAFWTSAAEAAQLTDADKTTYLQSTLVSAYDIKQWIQQSFAANDAMRFKGTISIDGNGNISNTTDAGTVAGFPTSCEVGDTYKVSGNTIDASSQIAGESVSSGDLVVCIADGTGNSLNSAIYWTIVQDNVEHLIEYKLNGTTHYVYTQSANNITLFAPTSAGIQGLVLVSAGGTSEPVWTNANTLTVAEAAKVTGALTKGVGITMVTTTNSNAANSYNGSSGITIGLASATTSSIGGIILDDGTNSEAYNAATNTSHTAKPTISIATGTNAGQLYLSKDNIINALGYTPGNTVAGIDKVAVASAADGVANASSATANPYINIVSTGNTVLGSYRISGSGSIGVTSTANSAAITISLNAADNSNYGGIKLGYSDANEPKNFAVQLDSNGKAFVNVPWVSSVFSASADGLVPMASTANKLTNNADNVATNAIYLLGHDAKWYKLPASAFQSDRRIVQLNGTDVITAASGNALNIVPGDHVSIVAEQVSSAYTGKVTFSAIWRDVQVRKIQTVNNNTTIGETVSSIGGNDPLVFGNSDSVFMLGEDVTIGSGNDAVTKTEIKAHITWYNMDTSTYEMV